MSELSVRIQHRREELGMSQEELAKLLSYSTKSSISKIETGVNDVPRSKLVELASALDTTVAYLLGLPDDVGHTGNEYVPLVVSYGQPLSDAIIDSYIPVPAGVSGADFAMVCKGDSMRPALLNGDIVYIQSCNGVQELGKIYAVNLGDKIALRRVYYHDDITVLVADNSVACPPEIFKDVQIIGKVIGLSRSSM